MNRSSHLIAAPGVGIGLWVAGICAVAQAEIVYQGNDLSYTTDFNRRTVICDEESDSHGVHADYDTFLGARWRIDDQDGAGGYCWESERHSAGIQKHRTVEEIDNWPDHKSAWSTH